MVRVFACGDVMPGRGLDQVLPHPGDPELREAVIRDARAYVRLAEQANGPIPRPVSYAWPWGDALPVLEDVAPDVRLINLETSVTRSADFAPGKSVHYRMSPENLPCVAAARPDACMLANNHVLDFGRAGLEDTLSALGRAGLGSAGAGRDAAGAGRPAVVPAADGGNDGYRLHGARRYGTAFMRGAMRALLRHGFNDPMSGMYAVNDKAIPLLARPYSSEAPEVEALLRISEAGLRLEEVPVHMRPRASGESKLRGRKAVGVVVTVAGALWMGRRLMMRDRKRWWQL